MPVRIVCPSCATQLNVRDEHAGRPVKCPKCQYIIPPSQATPPVIPAGAAPPDVDVHPATPVAAPLPVPPKSAGGAAPPLPTVEPFDDPAPRPKPPARPAPPAADRGEPPPRSAGRPPRDRDRDRTWDDADEGDRPRRRPRRRDEDADDDADRPKKKGSKVGLLLAVFGGILLVCCGGGGYGIYYAYTKIKEKAQQVTGVLELAVKLPGAWVVDEEASRELRGPGFQGGGFFLTFRENGTAEYGNPQSRSSGRWEIKERSGDMTEVWLRPQNGGPTSYILKVKLLDDDHLEVGQNAYCGGCRMKRAGPAPGGDTGGAMEQAKENRAILQATEIRNACEAYYINPQSNNMWPKSLNDLVKPPFGGGEGGFLKEGEKDLLDPWGKPFMYAVGKNEQGDERPYVWTERQVDGKSKVFGTKPPDKKK